MAKRLRAWSNLFLMTQGDYEKKTNISWGYPVCQAWIRCFLEHMSYTLRKYLGNWGYFWTPANERHMVLCGRNRVALVIVYTHLIGGPVISRGVTVNLHGASWAPFLLCQCPLPPVLTAKATRPCCCNWSSFFFFLLSLPSAFLCLCLSCLWLSISRLLN